MHEVLLVLCVTSSAAVWKNLVTICYSKQDQQRLGCQFQICVIRLGISGGVAVVLLAKDESGIGQVFVRDV